jgi:hypothetical protein
MMAEGSGAPCLAVNGQHLTWAVRPHHPDGMAASSRLMITEAERQSQVRIVVAVPPDGFGERLNRMHAWLDDNLRIRDDEPARRGPTRSHKTL